MTESSGLRAVAAEGDIAAISRLVDAGADPNATDDSGLAPLHAADMENEDPTVLATLIDAGADPNLAVVSGFTALHAAAYNTNPAVPVALIGAGAALGDRRYAASLGGGAQRESRRAGRVDRCRRRSGHEGWKRLDTTSRGGPAQ